MLLVNKYPERDFIFLNTLYSAKTRRSKLLTKKRMDKTLSHNIKMLILHMLYITLQAMKGIKLKCAHSTTDAVSNSNLVVDTYL